MFPVEVIAERYELGALLGRGAMGVVFAAHDRVLARDVAVKVLNTSRAPEQAVERFRREAQYLAGLAHPNIVTVYDFGLDGDRAWLVMERLPGPTLAGLIADTGPLPVDDVLRIGQDCAAALAAAHTAGVIHRDVKPANVMLADDGRCKLLDLGIARLAGATATSALTQAGLMLGTVPFLAPEVISGGLATPAVDLYALGAVLFTLLTGQPPYDSETTIATLAQHVNAPVPHPTATRPEVPADLDALVVALLAKAPHERPDAVSVQQRLAATAAPSRGAATAVLSPATAVLEAPTAGVDLPTTRWPRRLGDRALWLAAGVVAVLLVAGVVAFSTSGSGKPAAAARATPPPSSTPAAPAPSTAYPSTPRRDPITELRAAITAAAASGALTPDAATDLRHRVDAISGSTTTGNHDLAHQLADFAHRLSDLARQGQLSAAGYQNIGLALQAVATASGNGNGDGGDGGD